MRPEVVGRSPAGVGAVRPPRDGVITGLSTAGS
jgi:actin-like ATPase involved in cell morphogenesis